MSLSKHYDRPIQEVLAEMTGGGVDRSVECTGNVDAMISAFECVHDVLVGVPHKDAVFKTHPMNVLNERTLKGTFFGKYKPRTVVEMYMNKELQVEKFITHEVHSLKSTRHSRHTCSKRSASGASSRWIVDNPNLQLYLKIK